MWRQPWLVVSAALIVGQAVMSLGIRQGFAVVAYTDLNYLVLVLLATTLMVSNARAAQGQRRVFWWLLAGGCGLWSISLGVFVYYEVWLGKPTPDLSASDVTLFFHVVPLTAAVAMRPHVHQERPRRYLNSLSFLLLLLWWVYLYAFLVLPFQYLEWNLGKYNPRFDTLYMAESLVLLLVLGAVLLRAQGAWRRIYRHLFIASALYAFSSQEANAAMYLSGTVGSGIYDVLYGISIGWFLWVAVLGGSLDLQEELPANDRGSGALASPMASLAVLSIPAVGIWELFRSDQPHWRHQYRLGLSLAAIVLMGACVFLKQYLQDRQLLLLLMTSQRTLDALRKVQAELVQKEKMASLGQLVGGQRTRLIIR